MLIYIASLPHSGSTLLSLLLAKHPSVVALGEVRLQIGKIRRDPARAEVGRCGCGAVIRECPLWGAFLKRCSATARPVEDLQLAVAIMRELEGPETFLVDASKIREPIEELAAGGLFPVRVVHLSRDYRSWIVSAADLRRRKGKRMRPGWWMGFEGARRWTRENRKLERAISASGFPSMRLGYEELVLAPEQAWPALLRFLGLPAMDAPRDVTGARNHIFSGNRMRENDKKQGVAYDGRWFGCKDWRACSALLPGMASLNRRWTYSHRFAGQGDQEELEHLAASHGFEP